MTLRRVVKKKRETRALAGEKRLTRGVSEDGSGFSLARRGDPDADRSVTRVVFPAPCPKRPAGDFSFLFCGLAPPLPERSQS